MFKPDDTYRTSLNLVQQGCSEIYMHSRLLRAAGHTGCFPLLVRMRTLQQVGVRALKGYH